VSFDIKRQKILARRMFVFGAFKTAIFATFAIKIAKLQILNGNSYKKLSEDNRRRKIVLVPKRGLITDKNGIVIANNQKYYRLVFTPSNYEKDLRQIQRLTDVLSADEVTKKQMLKRYKVSKGSSFVIYKYLTRNELLKVSVNALYLQSVTIDRSFLRIYKDQFAYSSVVGYVSENDDLNKDFVKSLDIKIGKNGLEKHYNNLLMGVAGVKIAEVDSRGKVIETSIGQYPIDGTSLITSIDSRLQEYTYNIIKDKIASVVVIHIPTNSVLASVSSPTFNADNLSNQVSNEEWYSLKQNPNKPLMNRVFSALYPPGSIFKIPVALSILNEGISAEKEEYCPGYFYYGNHKFNCWKKDGHGKVDMLKAIQQSCNVYFYKNIKNMDIEKVASLASSLGLGTKPYNPILQSFGWENGVVASPKWKIRNIYDIWRGGDSINFGIGQGYNLINCFQLALMISRVASGKIIEPNFIINKNAQIKTQDLNIDPQYLEIVKKGMFKATNEAGGTSYFSRLSFNDFHLCGKTGSAQTVSRFIEKNAKREDFENTHGLFVGFAPFKDPIYAISVINEHGGFGSSSAAPIAKQIIEFAKNNL
jgi:penicillin-binding protein 2